MKKAHLNRDLTSTTLRVARIGNIQRDMMQCEPMVDERSTTPNPADAVFELIRAVRWGSDPGPDPQRDEALNALLSLPDGLQLRVWRLFRGLSQAEIADRAGVHKETVIRIERGERVKPSTFWRVDQAVKSQLDTDDLRKWLEAASAPSTATAPEPTAAGQVQPPPDDLEVERQRQEVIKAARSVIAMIDMTLTLVTPATRDTDEAMESIGSLQRNRKRLFDTIELVERTSLLRSHWSDATREWIESTSKYVDHIRDRIEREERHINSGFRDDEKTVVEPEYYGDDEFVFVRILSHALDSLLFKFDGHLALKSLYAKADTDMTSVPQTPRTLPVQRALADRLDRPVWLYVGYVDDAIDATDAVMVGDYVLIDRALERRGSPEPEKLYVVRRSLDRTGSISRIELEPGGRSFVVRGRSGSSAIRLDDYEVIQDVVRGEVVAIYRVLSAPSDDNDTLSEAG